MEGKTKVMGKAWAESLRLENIASHRQTLQILLGENKACTFEIGCGHGHWLAAYAQKHPEEFCLGIDLITDRIEKCQRKKTKQKITNIGFIKAEASELMDALSSEITFTKIFILYPDPWPKKRHHKNRFIQTENLTRLANHSAIGAKLHFRTDDENYFEWTLAELKKHPQWRILNEAVWPFETETFFEKILKAKRDIVAEKIL
ncbi:tRNA (guanosine(46)-N7)-methyltransferase TrmB [bacterium]|nr:tRNA (guanosine(46)-N7)-methyltransferase TrmB [bacterium]